MDPKPPTESQQILDQGEQLLDSSRRLLAHIDDALSGDASPETEAEATPGLEGELAV